MWEDNIYGTTTSVAGPQSDGTYVSPVGMAQPADAGGGPAASYGQQILDVFKYGVGVWQQDKARTDLLDYRRWEATNVGLTQQGRAGLVNTQANTSKQGSFLLLALIGVGIALAVR